MNEKENNTRSILHVITIAVSLVILTDFLLPGKVFQEKVKHVEKEKQNYYNATGNLGFLRNH